MARTHWFRIPKGISHPVILFEGTAARIIEFDDACGLTDKSSGRIPEAKWGKAREIRSNLGKLTLKTCRRTNDRSGMRGLSLTMTPAAPLSKRGGDFRRGSYHRFLDDLASGSCWASAFIEDLRTTEQAQEHDP